MLVKFFIVAIAFEVPFIAKQEKQGEGEGKGFMKLAKKKKKEKKS